MAFKMAPSRSFTGRARGRGALRPTSHAHSVLLPALAACGMNPVPVIALRQATVGKAHIITGNRRQDDSDIFASGGGGGIWQAY